MISDGKIYPNNSLDQFLAIPIGGCFVSCQYQYKAINGAVPVNLVRKIRNPTQNEINGAAPMNNTGLFSRSFHA